MNKRRWLFRGLTLAGVLILAAVMFIVGRGHTVYVDNKTLEVEGGENCEAFQRVEVYVGEERLSKLAKRERTMKDVIGQSFSMRLVVTRQKGDEPQECTVNLNLPYGWDGIVVNVPGYLAGLPQEQWMTEFIPAPEPVTEEEEVPIGEDDGLLDEF